MRTTFYFPLVLVLLASAAQAAEPFDAAARSEAIAPFIDEQTIAILHADLTRIEVDPLLDKLIELNPELSHELNLDRSRPLLNGCRDAFSQSGFSDVYVLFSLADLPVGPPVVILPRTDGSDFDALLEAWPSLAPSKNRKELVRLLDNVLFLGSQHALDRIQSGTPDIRAELETAFQAAGDTDMQLLLLPTDRDRRVIEELMPELPEEIDGGPSTIVTRGVQWAAAGWNTPPGIIASFTVQSKDNASAVAFCDKLATSLGALALWADEHDVLQGAIAAAAVLVPKVEGDRVTLELKPLNPAMDKLLADPAPPLEEAQKRRLQQADRAVGMNNLKYIGLAMHGHHDVHKRLPAVANYDANGNPLLSWRVHILRFLEEDLYQEFHLDEPWDSDHNKPLIARMPEVYRSPDLKKAAQGYTPYVLPVHEGTAFPGHRGIEFKEITDGMSNTIMAVEVDDDAAVIWTKPDDLPFDPDNPTQGLGGLLDAGFRCVFSDGSVRVVPLPLDHETLRCLFLRADGKPVSF